MELNGQCDRQAVAGRTGHDSGSHQWYLGLRLTAGQHWSAGFAFGNPLVEHFDGHQDELD